MDMYRERRQRLLELVDHPVLLAGNAERSRNLPMNKVRFRQDSSLLYFTGCALPGAAAYFDGEQYLLFVPEPAADDALWHGHSTTLAEIAQTYGADQALPRRELTTRVPTDVYTLAVGDEEVNRELSAHTGQPLRFGTHYGHDALVDAVIDMRRRKSPAEIEQMRLAARHSRAAFEAVISGTRPGGHERSLTALFEGVLAARGCTTGYDTILTQSGEVLHNHHHGDPLEAGRLLLLDGGGEVASGYGVDITRTWPVSGRFTPRQRATYDAVLASQLAAIDAARVGVRNRVVHDTAARVLTEFLISEGLLTGSVDDCLAEHAHGLFFPHGIGHHLGLDVHDLENFGDRSSYPADRGRPQPFGTRYLRLDLPLEAGWVITVEPGLYIVPAILEDEAVAGPLRHLVDLERARDWYGFGGIRIEDDILITDNGPEYLTDVPKDPDAIEALVGSGPSAEERLCCT